MLHLIRLISLRHLVGSPLRSALTIVGVAVGVATMVGITAINRSVVAAFRSTVETISGKADLTVASSEAGFPEEVLEQVKAVPGVLHAASALTELLPVHGSPGESLYVMAVDFLDEGYFRDYQGADRELGKLADDLELLNSTDRILLSERFARAHGLKTGDTFKLVTSGGVQDFVVHALVKEEGPIKAFGGSVGVMFLGSAQEALHRPRTINRIDVAVDPAQDPEQVRARLQQALGPTFEVERPGRRGASVATMVRSFQMGLNLGSGVALLVGVFLVYNTIAIGVVQRRREIGALRALGATRRRIRALFTLEAVVMGSLGTALGLPMGLLISQTAIAIVSRTISSLYVHVNANEVHATAMELALGIAMGVGGSALAALRPAVVASGVAPVEALRRDVFAGASVGSIRSQPVLIGFGMLLLAYPLTLLPVPVENLPVGGYLSVAALMAAATLTAPLLLRSLRRLYQLLGERLLGISGRLAADNYARVPGRTAVPVSALALGVGMSVCISGFVHSFQVASTRWIEQTIPADLFITSSAKMGGVTNRPLQPELANELATIPGVRYVDQVRVFRHDVLGLRVYIISLHADAEVRKGRAIILEGRTPTPEERRAGKLVISENLSRRRNLHPGGTFQMSTPTGLRTYTVSGVALDYTSDQGSIFMDRDIFVDHFKDPRVDTFELYLEDRSKLEEIRRTVSQRWGAQYNLFVLSNRELREEAQGIIDSAFSVTYAMEVVAVLLSLLGVINTLLAAVLDRTREIGLLRAIGASRAHVTRLFIAEAGFIGLSGAILGVALGVLMGIVLTDTISGQATGWTFPFLFPYAMASQVLVAATACAVLAGIYPARRAARLDVVEALAYE